MWPDWEKGVAKQGSLFRGLLFQLYNHTKASKFGTVSDDSGNLAGMNNTPPIPILRAVRVGNDQLITA